MATLQHPQLDTTLLTLLESQDPSSALTYIETHAHYPPPILTQLITLLSSKTHALQAHKAFNKYCAVQAASRPSSAAITNEKQRFYATEHAQQEPKNKGRDKRIIAAIVNALFSIIGVGIASYYWGAYLVGNDTENRMLLAIATGIVVTIAEAWLLVRQIQEVDRQDNEEQRRRSLLNAKPKIDSKMSSTDSISKVESVLLETENSKEISTKSKDV